MLSKAAAPIPTTTLRETYRSAEESWENPPDPVGLNLSSRTKKNHAGEPDENHRRHTEPEEPGRNPGEATRSSNTERLFIPAEKDGNGTGAKVKQPR